MHTVVAAVLVREGRALLGHRSPDRRWYPDVWDVVGGHVREGESPEEALVRELSEELGIRIDVELGEPLTRVIDHTGQDGGLDIVIWVVTTWEGEIVNRAPDEHDELQWFSPGQLLSLRLAHRQLPALLNRVLFQALS